MIPHDKFIDKIKQYIDEKKLFSFGDHVIIGLSGGADSVCLLLVLKRLQQVYNLLKEAEMLVIASPIYYHGISGQLKCVIDRFYSAAYPRGPKNLKKAAMILSSGDANMYEGALFSFKGDFLDYLGLENMGVFTAHGSENKSEKKREELRAFGASLR